MCEHPCASSSSLGSPWDHTPALVITQHLPGFLKMSVAGRARRCWHYWGTAKDKGHNKYYFFLLQWVFCPGHFTDELSNLWFQQMETEQIISCSKSKALRFESAVKGELRPGSPSLVQAGEEGGLWGSETTSPVTTGYIAPVRPRGRANSPVNLHLFISFYKGPVMAGTPASKSPCPRLEHKLSGKRQRSSWFLIDTLCEALSWVSHYKASWW